MFVQYDHREFPVYPGGFKFPSFFRFGGHSVLCLDASVENRYQIIKLRTEPYSRLKNRVFTVLVR